MMNLANANALRTQINFAEQPLTKRDVLTIIRDLQSRSSIHSVLSIDLSDYQTLTADKLSLLVNCKKYADEKGVKLVLKGVSPSLQAFFELTRMNTFFRTSAALVA